MKNVITGLVVVAVLGFVGYSLLGGNSTTAYTNPSKIYELALPAGWYAHELHPEATMFAKQESIENIQSEADLGPTFFAATGNLSDLERKLTVDEWLEANSFNRDNEFGTLALSEDLIVAGLEMKKIAHDARDGSGRILTYLYFAPNGNIVAFSNYPHTEGSEESEDFEATVASISILPASLEIDKGAEAEMEEQEAVLEEPK